MFYPNQISHILTSMQPLAQMVGQIVIIKPEFTTTAANVSAGQEIFRNATNGTYASEETQQSLGTGDGSTTQFSYTLSMLPMRPNRVSIRVDGLDVATDDGSGNISGSGVTGTINYTTGALSVTFTIAPGSNANVIVNYAFDTEQNADLIREVELGLRIIPVVAKEHPLRISWSVPAQFAASAAIGLDVEDTLSVLAAQFIKTERDTFIISFISRAAGAIDPDLTFNASVAGTDKTRRAHYKDFKVYLDVADNKVIETAGRGAISWIVAGNNVAAVVKHVDGFIPAANIVPIGAHVIGEVDGKTIIKNPHMDANTWLAGYNGVLPGDSGITLAEWIPIYFTPTLTDWELRGKKAILSMYDVVLNMPEYFKKGSITNFNA